MDEDILQEENKNINSTTYLLPKNNLDRDGEYF